MQIYINNKLAALKQGTSFEYVSENRLFSGSDGYTLTITFPLKDCSRNQEIFGHINRADVSAGKVVFDCEIRDKSFYKFGCITITEMNESEVKTQFLDGRSELNFDSSFDKVYINELDLGKPATTSPASVDPAHAWWYVDWATEAVALPWVNDSSGNIQNCATYNDTTYVWHSDTKGLSWQPYLCFITKQICKVLGYTCNLEKWEKHEEYRFLLICNTLPYSWRMPEYARALPHWTVNEYFEKLELFLKGEFTIDHRAKSVNFAFTSQILKAINDVQLDNVIEEHSTEVKVENDRCDYLDAKNIVYKECDHRMWKLYSCDWFIKAWKGRAVHYERMSELLAATKKFATWDGYNNRSNEGINKLYYSADVDAYFIINAVSRTFKGINSFGKSEWEYKCVLQPVNLLGGRIVDNSEEADTIEVEFVPARIDDTDATYGKSLFLSFSGYDDADGPTYGGGREEDPNNYGFRNSLPIYTLEAGEQSKQSEYYDRIYIAWWDGAGDATEWGKLPHPYVENILVMDNFSNYRRAHFSLRLNHMQMMSGGKSYDIEPTQKTTFKFLSDTIPDVRALYIIRGKRYICEKLTATFTENGMSQLIKGVFYPVKD